MKDSILRGKILAFLKTLYPDGAELQTVILILYQYYKTEDIEKSLEYLSDKEYIVKKELPHPWKNQDIIRWYKITPKGVDLIDGSIPADPGITICKE